MKKTLIVAVATLAMSTAYALDADAFRRMLGKEIQESYVPTKSDKKASKRTQAKLDELAEAEELRELRAQVERLRKENQALREKNCK